MVEIIVWFLLLSLGGTFGWFLFLMFKPAIFLAFLWFIFALRLFGAIKDKNNPDYIERNKEIVISVIGVLVLTVIMLYVLF